MKVKSTKSALLMSFTSLLLCFAMLIGCTFAWFTDSVTSGVNKIQAGNLDIEVSYKDASGSWVSIEDVGTLFNPNALWEPGHTEFVTLKIENKGTLALKYQMNVSPVSESGGINVAGESFKLSDYLMFGVTDAATTLPTYDRATARNAVSETTKLNAITKSGTMAASAEAQYVTLVVYMPETVGNEANYKTGTAAPFINLGITVLATQLNSESDSFNNEYDAATSNDTSVVYNYFPQVTQVAQLKKNGNVAAKGDDGDNQVTDASGKITITSAAKVGEGTDAPVAASVTFGNDAVTFSEGDTATVTLDVKKVNEPTANITVADTQEKVAFDVNVTITGAEFAKTEGNFTNPMKVTMFIGKGKTNLKLYHGNTEMTKTDTMTADTFTYNPNTGVVTMYVNHFSEFTAVYDEPVAAIGTTAYYSLESAVAAAQSGETVTLVKDVDLSAPVEVSGKEITLNMAGKTIKYVGSETVSGGIVLVHNGAGLTVTGNGKVESGEKAYAAIALTKQGDSDATPAKLTVQNGTFVGNYYAIVGNGSRHNTEITINDGKFSALDGLAVYHPQNGTMTVKGGTFTGTESAIELRAGTLIITGGTFTATAKPTSVTANGNGTTSKGAAIAIAQHTTKLPISVNITGGNFNAYTAIYESNPQNNDAESIAKVQMSIAGGTFTATQDGTLAVYSEDCNNFITGGTFSSDPKEYVKTGYCVVGTAAPFTVAECTEHTYGEDHICTKCGDKEYVAPVAPAPTVTVSKPEDLAGVVENAEACAIIGINAAGTYKVPGISKNIDIVATVNGVVFDCVGSGSIASIPNGCTFWGGTFNFGQTNYHGFQHAGHIKMNNCTLNGLFFSYGDMTFENCTFNSPGTEYCMWCYAGNVTYKHCTANVQGKFANVYNEGNNRDGKWTIIAEDCTFNSTESNKAALNIKENCCNGEELHFDVTIKNCTATGVWPAATVEDGSKLIVLNSIAQVDDRSNDTIAKSKAGNGVKVTMDGTVIYPAN